MNYENTGEYAVYRYSDMIPSGNDYFPDNRVMDFLVTGPFVLETDGAFETEHLYDREKILLEDYLISDGGERSIVPRLGESVRNNYYGREFFTWQKGFIKWNCLRFDREEDACDPALYATRQHNAVYYCAFYLDCDKDEKAVLCYEDSGSTLFVNGEQVDFQPFGRVKGLWGLGHQCFVHFRRGRNLVLFKLRPGYIADTMDISISNCSVFPVIAENGGLLLTSPTVTLAYSGTKAAPRQLFPAFVAAESDTDEAVISCSGTEEKLAPMKKGEIGVVRLGIPSEDKTKEKAETVSLIHKGTTETAKMYFIVSPYDGFEGTERIFSDFHFDTTYHQEQCTYALGAFHITKSILERLEENPDFKATLSEIDYLHPYYSLFPEHRETLRKAFREGRAEADCFYNQPNDLTSSGEAFVRNLVYGQLYHRDVLGRLSTVYAPGDVFGHFSQLTQVCKKGGCDYIRWGKAMLGTDNLFRHASPDGSTLLHDKGFGRRDAQRFGVSACAASSEGVSHIEAVPREGNTDWMKQTVNRLRFSVFSELASDVNESVKKQGKDSPVGLSSRDLTRHHSGVLLTRTDFKQANRLCENLLVTAEKFAAVAALYGAEYPEQALDKAWRQLLCAQHHDSVTGTNNEISFVDLMIQYRECAMLAADTVKRAAAFIASGVKTDDRKRTVFVFNPCAFERGGECIFELPADFRAEYAVLKDGKGREYPLHINGKTASFLAPSIPATGYAAFRIEEREAPAEEIVIGNDTVIENARFRIEVTPQHGGGIMVLYDKKLKKDFMDVCTGRPGNMITVLREVHDRMEPQHEIYTTGQKLEGGDYPAEITSEKSELRQTLKIRTKLGTVATAYQEITITKNSGRVDFRTVIEDYNGEDDLFSVIFPLDLRGGAVLFDDRFAPHVSTRSKKYMSFQTHQYASFSGCSILPANRWFGTGTSAVLDFGKVGNLNIGMTAIIAKEKPELRKSAEKLLLALTKKGVPVTLYPDTEQHGGMKIVDFREDIYETDTRFVLCTADDIPDYAAALIEPLSRVHKELIVKRTAALGCVPVFLRDPDRKYGKNVDVLLFIAENAEELGKFTEKLARGLADGYSLDLSDAVFGDIPGAAEDKGAELINSGNIACSVEGKNTLNLMLFHTAAFYGNQGKVTGGRELVPEKKTHCFTYAFYPHKDSYREGGTYREADAYNERLFAVTDTNEGENVFLPEEMSFLKVNGNFSVTAFKAGGYPMASMKTPVGIRERGLTIRGFETDGKDAKVTVKTGFGIEKAETTDLLGEEAGKVRTNANSFSFNTGAHSVDTFTVFPAITEKIGSGKIGTEQELTETTYVRSWEHDMGSMPMGYFGFAAFLSRKPMKTDGTHTTLDVIAVNNSADEATETRIVVVCSEGLKADRTDFTVSLEPTGHTTVPIVITADGKDRKGQVKIFYTYAGKRFTDVYEFGYFDPEITLKIRKNDVLCTVTNPTDQHLDAWLYLASPFETWGLTTESGSTLGGISPFCRELHLAPYEKTECVFDIEEPDEGFFKAWWAAAKLCCNGRIRFAFDEKHGPRHTVWAHEFIHEIEKDNGSIRKLLDM